MDHPPRLGPGHVLVPVVSWLVVAWTVFLSVDLRDVFGLRGRTEDPLWYHLFNDRPTEWATWLLLGGLVLACGYLVGRLESQGAEGARRFWLVFGLAAILMLFEDAGDVRHVLAVGADERWWRPAGLGRGWAGIAVEGAWFVVLGAVPLYALVRYGRWPYRSTPTRPYLVAGVVVYATAAIGSAVRDVGGTYITIGRWFHDLLARGEMQRPDWLPHDDVLYFHLVDGPVEESLELLGAALLLAAATAYRRDLLTGDPRPPS